MMPMIAEMSIELATLFNQYLDAVVAGAFLVLVGVLTIICVWEWYRLLARHRAADLRESEPVWLPEYAVAEGRPIRFFGFFALGMALAKELSGEAALERAEQEQAALCCHEAHPGSREDLYVQQLEERYKSVRRCC